MEKSRHVRVIERNEVRGDDPNKYFFLKVVRSTFWVSEEVMAVKGSQNEDISKRGGKGVSSFINRRRANKRAWTLRNESE